MNLWVGEEGSSWFIKKRHEREQDQTRKLDRETRITGKDTKGDEVLMIRRWKKW